MKNAITLCDDFHVSSTSFQKWHAAQYILQAIKSSIIRKKLHGFVWLILNSDYDPNFQTVLTLNFCSSFDEHQILKKLKSVYFF